MRSTTVTLAVQGVMVVEKEDGQDGVETSVKWMRKGRKERTRERERWGKDKRQNERERLAR